MGRKAKIVCTIGPASSSRKTLYRMVRSGMNIARLNFSHGSFEEHKRAVEHIKSASENYNLPVAVLQDLRGLKIRTGRLKTPSILIKKGATLALTSRNIKGDSREIQIEYPRLSRDLKAGDIVLIDDGLLQLKVIHTHKSGIITRVMEGGILKEKKGVNFPGVRVTAPGLTEKDIRDIEAGIRLGVDYIAVSFVRSQTDILRVRRQLKKHTYDIPVIAKIENRQALDNIEEIIKASDGLMIARGDLGVEVPPEEVPIIQKELIEKCNKALKPVITATQMLDSMTEHSRPTRAEAADVANAVIDGTDALMLSGETAIGKYPVGSLKMMDRIITYTEDHMGEAFTAGTESDTFAKTIAKSACTSATDIQARTIAAFTLSGFTALLVSKFRPATPVTGFTASNDICRRMCLYWGVTPYVMKYPENIDEMISETESTLLKKRIVKKGDSIVIIAVSPFTLGGKSNIMKIHKTDTGDIKARGQRRGAKGPSSGH